MRRVAGIGSFALLILSLLTIWVLTEQTPAQTGYLTRRFANMVDDIKNGCFGNAYFGADEGSFDQPSRTTPCSIVGQPEDCSARVGEFVSFHVMANDAVTYLWECTDPGTVGWYQISGVDATKPHYEFEMTNELTWMKECRIRCLVTFADGSSTYSHDVHIEFRDVMKNGKSFRRLAHIVEFGAVGFFAALCALLLFEGAYCRRTILSGCLAFCMVNSLLDQFHKLFVPGREFDIVDLALDAFGYVLAISLVFGVWRWLNCPRSKDAR